MKLNTAKEFNDVFQEFKGYVTPDLAGNICEVINYGGYVIVDKINPKNKTWDGALTIHFAEIPSAKEIVNRFVSLAHADEFQMLNDKTLHFWWD
jgi:hypothetical protein